jgi:hypothetical protein
MSFSAVYDAEQRLGVARLGGKVDAARFQEAMIEFYLDDDWQPGYAALWDLQQITRLVIVPDDIAEILSVARSLEPRMGSTGKAAFVASSEPAFSMASLLTHRTTHADRPRRAFQTLEAAVEWLGVSLQ